MLNVQQIDAIVREVLLRLRQHQISPSPAGRSNPIEPATQGASSAGIRSTQEIAIPERLVTVATLDGRLQDILDVRFVPNAVVTPAARDLMSQRGIRWSRDLIPTPSVTTSLRPTAATASHGSSSPGNMTPPGGAPATGRGLLVVQLHPPQSLPPTPQFGHLPSPLTLRTSTSIDDALSQLQRHIATGGIGAMLSLTPEATTCAANRREAISAFHAIDESNVLRAVETCGANVLVSEPSRGRGSWTGHLLRCFVMATSRNQDRVALSTQAQAIQQ